MSFFHGVQGFITTIEGRPVTALRSSIVGLVVTAGKGPVNVPTLIFGNLSKAYDLFGPSLGDGFTAGQSLKAVFDQIGTMVVVVNVCDPAVHNADIANEIVSLNRITGKGRAAHRYFVGAVTLSATISAPVTLDSDGHFAVPTGMTISGVKNVKGGSVITTGSAAGNWHVVSGVFSIVGAVLPTTYWVTYTATLVLDTDYTVQGDLGQITRVSSSTRLLPSADLTVTYTYVDPTAVDATDIVGIPASGGNPATGIYALRAAPTIPGVLTKARLLAAPGFSHTLSVASALNQAASVLNGRAFVDAPNASVEAAIEYKANFAGDTDRVSVHYPNYYIDHPAVTGTLLSVPASAFLVGSQSRVDKNDGQGNPHVSLSNKQIRGIAGLTRPVEHTVVNLGETNGESTAQWLNENDVMTTIREGGWRAYGNTQANGDFLCVQRTADYILESSVLALVWAIDKAINGPALLDQILTVVRQFLRACEAQGVLVANPSPDDDNDVWFPPELNTPDQTALGTAYLNFRMNPPPPLQRLVVTGQLTHEFVRQLFTDSQP